MRASPDVLVVGGGPGGATAAIRLAEGGARVTLIEREAGAHDKVCGEFVSGEARTMLAGLGLAAAWPDAPEIDTLAVVAGAHQACAPLPFTAMGLARRRMDEDLLATAAARGVRLRRGVAVSGLARDDGDGLWRARLSDGMALAAPVLVLAVGKHDLRGHARPRPADADLVGLKTHLALREDATRGLRGRIALVLFDGGYAGLQLVDGGRANLCVVARAQLVRGAGGDLEAVLARIAAGTPLLADALAGARPLFERPLAIARIPYGHVHRPSAADPPGLYRLGDQAGVVPSFCGDGLAIALHTGLRAAGAILAGASAADHHARIAAEVGPQIARARMLERLGRSRPGRRALIAALRIAPALAGPAVAATRVPEDAWRDALINLDSAPE